MTTYKLTIQYQGTAYFGWQIQADVKTVQGELNKALGEIVKTDQLKTLGASRTDAGVHALGQVCKVEIPLNIEAEGLLKGLNTKLPSNVRVVACEQTRDNFHPIYEAKKKTYSYIFSQKKAPNCFQSDLMANVSFELNFDLLEQACSKLVGTHDFMNYFCTGSDVSGTVRDIFSCELHTVRPGDFFSALFPPCYEIRITGSGFLKQMVRLLVGAMWNVSRGKVSLAEFEQSLTDKRADKLGPVAPASGLYLKSIFYQ